MEKKIIQALYAYIVDKSELRPIMNGVHFESERCYASDGHILVIYDEGKPELAGKTLSVDGKTIDGKYPNVDKVFPKKEDYGTKLSVDLLQLRNACQWQTRQEGANENDCVVINGVGYNIRTLMRMCNMMLAEGKPRDIKFYNGDPARATVIIGHKLKGLIMPSVYEEVNIDSEREEYGYTKTYSYESLINDYVFNSWKKPEKKESLAWLD